MDLEAHIASQANFNPALMQQKIDELQISVAVCERQLQTLSAKHEVSMGMWTQATFVNTSTIIW